MNAIQTTFATALQYHKSGQLAEAETQYLKILEQDKFHVAALINLGVIYKNKGNFVGAIQLYRTAIAQQPYDLTANYQLAVALRLTGELDEALKSYKRALSVQPFDANLLYETANVLLQLEQLDEAIFYFKNAAKLNPNFLDCYLNLGYALMLQGNFEASINGFQQALKLAPNSVKAYNGIATVFVRQGRLDEALANFAKAKELNPKGLATQQWFSFVQRLRSGLNEVSFTYEGEPVKFWITGKNLPVELPHSAGEFYEVKELEFIRQNLSPGSVIVDVGCNVGNHLVYFAKFMKAAKVIPFEVQPQVIEILKKNISLNEISDRVDLSNLGLAIGRSRGKASLKEHPLGDFCMTEVWETEGGEIDIVPLDEAIAEKVDLIKIDVESIELEVLQGAKNLIRASQPHLLVEVRKYNKVAFMGFIKTLGYAVAKEFDCGNFSNFYLKPAE